MTAKWNQLPPLSTFSHQELPDDIRANLTEELPQPREVPRKLCEYTQEEIDAFPRLWTPYVERTQIQSQSVNTGDMQAWLSMQHSYTGRREHATVVQTQALSHQVTLK